MPSVERVVEKTWECHWCHEELDTTDELTYENHVWNCMAKEVFREKK